VKAFGDCDGAQRALAAVSLVQNDEPAPLDFLSPVGYENRNVTTIIDELMRERSSDEYLREKVSKIAQGLPKPLGLQFK